MTAALTLRQLIEQDMKSALRAQDKPRLGVLRLMLAAVKQREIDERITLDQAQTLAVLDKMLKQRRDSLTQYQNAGRNDLAAQERFEIEVIQSYMPQPLAESEIDAMIAQALQESGASTARDMGKVMGVLKPRLQGRADVGAVSAKVKARLSV